MYTIGPINYGPPSYCIIVLVIRQWCAAWCAWTLVTLKTFFDSSGSRLLLWCWYYGWLLFVVVWPQTGTLEGRHHTDSKQCILDSRHSTENTGVHSTKKRCIIRMRRSSALYRNSSECIIQRSIAFYTSAVVMQNAEDLHYYTAAMHCMYSYIINSTR